MDQGPLVSEQIAAAIKFLGEFHKCYPVQSAFWLKEGEDGTWSLYVVSDQITDDNFVNAYSEVIRIEEEMKDPWFDSIQVKVLGDDKTLANAVAELRRRYPAGKPARFFNQTVDGMAADEIYVYPSPLPVAVA